VLAGLAVIAILATRELTPLHGVLLLTSLLIYTLYAYSRERSAETTEALSPARLGEAATRVERAQSLGFGILLVIAGLGLLVLGGSLMVDSAVAIARAYAVPEAIIGLTLIAAGTSLPEVATSAIAAFRKQGDVAIGNVLGSTTFNALGILGATGLFGPLAVPAEISLADAAIAAGAPLLLMAAAVVSGRIGRLSGALMFGLYIAYVLLLAHRIGAI
jgi:cation:H+ antiporter